MGAISDWGKINKYQRSVSSVVYHKDLQKEDLKFTKDHIRLLRPMGKLKGSLVCELKDVSLEFSPPYAALSYSTQNASYDPHAFLEFSITLPSISIRLGQRSS